MKTSELEKQRFFIAKNLNKTDLIESQSGGMFRAITDIILKENGIIYGCILSDELEIKHIRVDNTEERNKMSGSKYVQSSLKDTFKHVKEDLLNGKKVSFFGTPCQVDGIRSYLENVNTDNFIAIDIICHGVPSPGIWKDYLYYLNKKYKGKICKFNFRNKKYGWESSIATFEVNGNEFINNAYNTLFYMHYIIRPSCFKCPYKNLNRTGDITIGDCWGIKTSNKLYDNKGVSLLIINSSKGIQMLNKLEKKIVFEKIDINEYMQPAILKNYSIPSNREKFWKDYKEHNFNYIAWKYGGENIIRKIKRKIKRAVNKLKRR